MFPDARNWPAHAIRLSEERSPSAEAAPGPGHPRSSFKDERRRLRAELFLFQQVWQKDGQIVAVRPQPRLAPYFAAIRDAEGVEPNDPKGDPDSGVTKAGATGLDPRPPA